MNIKEVYGDETVAESIKNHEVEEWGTDIMVDEDGRKYVGGYEENGTAGEDGYGVDYKRTYLPDELQND